MTNVTKETDSQDTIACPAEYAGWTIKQLAESMESQHYGFALVAGHTMNYGRAYESQVAKNGGRHGRHYSGDAAALIKRHSGVRAVIAKIRATERTIDGLVKLVGDGI